MRFTLQQNGAPRHVDFEPADLVVAGWTGRDEAALNAHIREMAVLGVAPPARTPMFYRLSASLLTTGSRVDVIGRDSSGEAEFVLFHIEDQVWVGLGSDHTDRKAESMGITLANQLCPKPVAQELWAMADLASHWDELILRSYAITGGERSLYQEGSVSGLRHPRTLMELYGRTEWRPGTVMFGGTMATIGGIRWADAFAMELEDPVRKRRIAHSYEIRALPIAG
jgi:hypothetical protein